ncbi:MAG: cytidine deaminase [SAR324 cluster bacterium]|nr:cytidine deaminase [SAR324 cluster bacterium]
MSYFEKEILERARQASQFSYSPYSNFKVGAAIEDEKGRIFVGTNVENVSYGASICAERSAVVSAIGAGGRNFKQIAIVCSGEVPVTPCGICRQFLAEFNSELKVLCSSYSQLNADKFDVYQLAELFPQGFLKF